MEEEKQFVTVSRIPVKPVYTPEELSNWDYKEKLGNPGEYPFTRGITPTMYRDNLWLMIPYAGFATAEATNEWFKYLLSQGATSLGIALDLPTQCGYDSDHPLALGEVGKQGVAIDSLADLETALSGLPLDKIRIACTANAIGPIYLAWILALAEKWDMPTQNMPISIQNDSLKEFFCRGTQIFPPKPSLKLTNDTVEYCIKNGLNNSHALCCCSYHIGEAGATAAQQIAFTMADAVAYIEELLSRGLDIDDIAPHLVTFVSAGVDLFEEVCKIRAFRRLWARMMKEKFHAKNPRSMKLFFRCQIGGSYMTAQQPLNNIVRATIGTLAAVLGGVQSVMNVSYDEALALPSPEAVRVALRTQQIIAYESGLVNTADALAGSYYVESLTNELEERTTKIFEQVEKMGGAVAAVEQGLFEREIAKSAYEDLKRVNSGKRVVVGVNKYVVEEPLSIQIRKIDPEAEKRQVKSLQALRKSRDNSRVKASLKQLDEAARDGVNLVPCLLDVVKTYATLGEMCDTLRNVYGEYKATKLL